jgi:GNAT superfamily N-acetyltransferase
MSLAELMGHDVAVHESDVESRRFGMRVVRVTLPEGGDARGVRAHVEGSGADLVIFRFPTARDDMIEVFHDSDWKLVPAGTAIYWEKSLSGLDELPDGNRVATAQEKATVARLIPVIFEGYRNHYSANTSLRHHDITDGYSEWALSRVDTSESFVMLLRQHTLDIGVATVAMRRSDAEVELAGIHPEHREKGHYATLMRGVEAQAHLRGAQRLVISTQASNIRVQRAWARLGFVPCFAVDTVHLMPTNTSGSSAERDA